jgi:hypothetical protein
VGSKRRRGHLPVTEWPWQFDRRVRYLLELSVYEDERIYFRVEGMDGQLIIALDERVLVVKPGFVREPDFGGLVASIYYGDVERIQTRKGLTNWVLKIYTQYYQLNESNAQTYQGNLVSQAKDFFLSSDPTSIPITRWQLERYRPHLLELSELVREAREA